MPKDVSIYLSSLPPKDRRDAVIELYNLQKFNKEANDIAVFTLYTYLEKDDDVQRGLSSSDSFEVASLKELKELSEAVKAGRETALKKASAIGRI